jgi:hypothetical protein
MFTRTVTLSAWLLATVLLCSPSLATETNAIPQRFHARIGGFMGFTYDVQLQDGRLEYVRSGGGQNSWRARVRPTMQQWREFRRELDSIGIWRWRAQYLNPGVADGTQWSLDVAYPNQVIKTEGSNDYPGSTPNPSGVPSESKVFTRYLEAVQRLVGGRAFD